MIRVLFVGFNREYVNRTTGVLINALRGNHIVEFYGPGYVDESALAGGPDRWIDRNGPYDLLLFDSYTAEYEDVAARPKPFLGDCVHFTTPAFFSYGPRLQEFVYRYSGPKVFIANWDVYAVCERKIERLEASGCHVLDLSLSRMTLAEKQAAFGVGLRYGTSEKGFWGGAGTDHWLRFVCRARERILEVPHAIALAQTSLAPLESRAYHFTVPGTGYAERRQVYRFLSREQRARQLAWKVQDRLYTMRHDSLTRARMLKLHLRYDAEIASSCMAYVSGSMYRTPVRKYFEIPALGAVPVGQLCEGFSDLGFVPGVNFVAAETQHDVAAALSSYSETDAQQVARAAQALVLAKHSEPARSRQLHETVCLIVAGRFRGSSWIDGHYQHHP